MEVFHSLNLESAARKLVLGKSACLNFGELRDLGIKLGESWEREVEVALEKATDHNTGLNLQFFQDARGVTLGYKGALSCLKQSIGQDYAKGLTAESYAALDGDWAVICQRVVKASRQAEASFEGVEYMRCLGNWHHAGSGKRVQPIRPDGMPMSEREFKVFVAALETLSRKP